MAFDINQIKETLGTELEILTSTVEGLYLIKDNLDIEIEALENDIEAITDAIESISRISDE